MLGETKKKNEERRKGIQWGLLNYLKVQRSVTSRQPSPALPTKVFLCGGSEGGTCWVASPGPDG